MKDDKNETAPATKEEVAAVATSEDKTADKKTRRNKRDSLSISTHHDDMEEKGTGIATTTPKPGGLKTPSDKKRQSLVPSHPTPMNATGLSPGPAMDVHPYPRGSVVEVLYIPATAVGKTTASIQAAMSGDPWYWSDDSSLCTTTSSSSHENTNDEDPEDDDNNSHEKKDLVMQDVVPKTSKAKRKKKDAQDALDSLRRDTKDHHHPHHHHHQHQNAASVRLCDIIDRVPVNDESGGEPSWRYYVHYRDFNRRMDEWIGKDRIVSPPSIGNAKARALKKEEDKQKRKQQRLEEKQRAELQKKEIHDDAPRSSRRRSSVFQPAVAAALGAAPLPGPSLTPIHSATTPTGVEVPQAEAEKGRRTTRLRRRSTLAMDDDAATVVTGNAGDEIINNNNNNNNSVPAAVKEILTLPTGNALDIATTTVGEHVVATIPAQELDEHEGLDEASLREHEEITKIKNVSFIELGRHQMETWYFSPIPKELLSQRGYIEVLYICEFTFRLFARKCELQRFQRRSLHPHNRHPPGNEIYRKDSLSMFEVDGLTEKIYCQNLCYVAKLFLDHKTLYFDVDPFLFYVLCEVDERGYHPVGYYSKEKYSDVGYNLACILTFPAHQRKGYGRFLIAFSYELSKKQEKVGGPERPVSDLGQKAYKPYWAATVIDFLRTEGRETDSDGNIQSSALSIMDISKKTSIMAEDIVFTLNQLGILKIINGVYFIAAEESLLEKLAKKYPVKEPLIDPSRLHWTPFLTDVKRDKFSIHSKKPNLDDSVAVVQQPTPSPQQPQAQPQPQQQQ